MHQQDIFQKTISGRYFSSTCNSCYVTNVMLYLVRVCCQKKGQISETTSFSSSISYKNGRSVSSKHDKDEMQ